jgi:hypothetical protein
MGRELTRVSPRRLLPCGHPGLPPNNDCGAFSTIPTAITIIRRLCKGSLQHTLKQEALISLSSFVSALVLSGVE